MEKLGQNFLVNKNIVQRIIDAANLSADDFVLEIGPGKGILTEELAKKAGRVVAVEIDKELVNLLRNKLRNYENVEIMEENILKLDLIKLISNFQFLPPSRDPAKAVAISNKIPKFKNPNYKLPITNYKIVANLPYYITSPIIRMFLEAELLPADMILMVQKEVAERICARSGKMSILSVAVQYYARPEILFYVGRENFDPVPEVDSAVIKISEIKSQVSKVKCQKFFKVVRAGFCAKRKTLANNLANSFHLDKKIVEEKIKAAGLSPVTRAQELSINDWRKLVKLF